MNSSHTHSMRMYCLTCGEDSPLVVRWSPTEDRAVAHDDGHANPFGALNATLPQQREGRRENRRSGGFTRGGPTAQPAAPLPATTSIARHSLLHCEDRLWSDRTPALSPPRKLADGLVSDPPVADAGRVAHQVPPQSLAAHGLWSERHVVRPSRPYVCAVFGGGPPNHMPARENTVGSGLREGRLRRQGLTLVEMMISVVLTLMVVFAVVRVFESLGDSVTDGRATIEMSGSLRTAAQLLKDDLDGVTVTSLPPRSPDKNEGYLELIDGPATDSQYPWMSPSTGLELAKVGLVGADLDRDGYLDQQRYDTCVGDIDDILAFTSYRPNRPFLGTVSDPRVRSQLTGAIVQSATAPTAVIEANAAEVVWWLQVERVPNGVGLAELSQAPFLGNVNGQIAAATGVADSMGNAIPPADQVNNILLYPSTTMATPVRSLHRRVLLIRPDLNLDNVKLNGQAEVNAFLSNNDISVRVVRDVALGGNNYKVIPNTLADLANRENRAFRSTWKSTNRTNLETTRMSTARTMGIMLAPGTELMRQGTMKDMVLTFPAANYPDGSSAGVDPVTVIMLRKGKDVVLNDVLAFDLKVWDPRARLNAKDGSGLAPHDPGYLSTGATPLPIQGAFVDLGFAVPPKVPTALTVPGDFAKGPLARSFLTINSSLSLPEMLTTGYGVATYGTWSSSYERDGIDQDGDSLADEGMDGLDNDNRLGIDDLGERETSPPYPHALRGLKVTVRTMDYNTRQVRQTSVAKDFLPE